MKIRTFKSVENGVYKTIIRTEDWSQLDQQLIAKYGEPSINAGGEIVSPYSDVPLVLPDHYVSIMSESPFSKSFDSRDYADAETRAATWAAYMADEIRAAVQTLRLNYDGFTTEEVETV